MATSVQTEIVALSVTLTATPIPSQYQQSAALVSVGGSTLTAGSYQFCATTADVDAILSSTGNYAELTNMANTFFAQNGEAGAANQGNISGCYVLELGIQTDIQDGIAALQAYITANPKLFYTYTTPADWDTMPAPAAPTVTATADSTSTLPEGTYYTQIAYLNAAGAIGQLSPVVTTDVTTADADSLDVTSPAALTGATAYLVYVGTTAGELYLQNGSTGTDLGTNYSLSAAPTTTGDAPSTTLADLGNDYSSPTGMRYILINSSVTNITAYGTMGADSVWSGYKGIIAVVPSPSAQAGEFTAAAWAYNVAINQPAANNKLRPMQFRYLNGVTPWPASGYDTEIQTMRNYGANYVGTGAEGGISNNCIFGGTTSALSQISAWYGLDWEMINVQQSVTAAVINGSNSYPPLEYDQHGINTLDAVAQQTADNGITFGCAQSAVVSSIPFYTYNQQQPDDYALGQYNGLSAAVVGQNGFMSLVFNMNVSFNAA